MMEKGKRSLGKYLKDILIILALAYILISTFFFIFHKDVLYSPIRDMEHDPTDIGLEFDDIYLDTEDGTKINGWYIPCEGANLTVLYCHGNACDLGGSLFYPKNFHSMGFDTFMIDYRGYGNSEGEPTEEGTYMDVMAAWNYLTEDLGKNTSSIIVYGRSLGGGIASYLAPRVSPGAFIMESTFTSFMDQVKDYFFWLPVGLIVDVEYPTVDNIEQADCPVMVIHGSDDIAIRTHHGKDLYERAPDPKAYLELDGDHNNIMSVSENEWYKGVEDFISEHVTVEV